MINFDVHKCGLVHIKVLLQVFLWIYYEITKDVQAGCSGQQMLLNNYGAQNRNANHSSLTCSKNKKSLEFCNHCRGRPLPDRF